MFEMTYMFYMIGVVLFLIPLILLLTAHAFRGIRRAVLAIVLTPYLAFKTGYENASTQYQRSIPVPSLEYAALLFMIALNILIVIGGVNGIDATLWKIASALGILWLILVALHLAMHHRKRHDVGI